MFYIQEQNPYYGAGYFTGFNGCGVARFQSCFDKYVKLYKTKRNARIQLNKIKPGGEYSIKNAPNIDNEGR